VGAAGLLALLAGLVAGILAGDRLAPAPATATLAAAAAVAVVATTRRGRMRLAVGALACALLGAALTQRAHHGLVESPLSAAIESRADARITVSLVDDADGGPYNARVLVRVALVDGRDAGGRTVLVTAGGDTGARLRLLAAGDRVELDGWFQPLAGTDRRLRWRHAVAHFDAVALIGFEEPTSPLLRVANALRARVLAGAERLPSPDGPLVAGFLLGDRRAVPFPVEQDFRDAGLSHLLAVSGANVVFVLALVGPILRRLSLRGRLAGGLAVLVVFGAMTRWEPSVLRACAMAACSMAAVYLGRPTAGLRVLVLAALALLVVDPFLLHSIAFLLSCGASAGIVVLGDPLQRRLRGPRWIREALGVTVAAQVGVAPVLIPVFGSIPLATLPANVLAVPAAGPLTVWGLVAGVASNAVAGWWPGLADALQVPTFVLVRYVRAVAEAFAPVPISVDLLGASVIATLVAAIGMARRRRRSTVAGNGVVPDR
jgi:competence protein ComEC